MRSLTLSQLCLTLNQRERSSVATRPLGSTIYETSYESEVLYLFFQWSRQPNVPTLGHVTRGVRLTCNGMHWSGVCRDEVILGASDPQKALLP